MTLGSVGILPQVEPKGPSVEEFMTGIAEGSLACDHGSILPPIQSIRGKR
jgi:hypothetical protein